jgi:Na+-transporting methylmalonyl-CoA/oxaloacetate decarboxylase gamma subunit
MENLAWGLGITVVGMGLVFGMLALLWGLLALALRLDGPAHPPHTSSAAEDEADDAAPAGDAIPADVVAAITIATLAHRTARRREAAPLMRSYWPGSLLFASRWVATGRARQSQAWQRRGR